MISSKVVITYKRKRPFSQLKLTHGLQSANLSLECPRSISLTRFSQKAELGHFSEKQKGHDRKRIPRGKRLCTACSEPHDSGKPVQQCIQEPKKAREINFLEGSEMGPIKLRSHKVLLKMNPRENASCKSEDCSLQVDASVEKKLGSTSINLYSNVDSCPAHEVACVEGKPGSQFDDMDEKRSRFACAESTIEEKCEIACHQDSFSQTSSERNDPLHKVKSNITCTDSQPKKFSNPLITFSRRGKRKCVDGTNAQKISINENSCSVVEGSGCTFSASQKCNSVDRSSAMLPEMNSLLVLRQDGQDEIACKDANHTQSSLSGGSSKTKIEHHDDQEQNTSRHTSIVSPVVEGVQELNSNQHPPSSHPKPDDVVQEDYCSLKCSKTSSTDISNEVKQSGSPKIGASIGEASRIISTGSANKSEGINGLDNIAMEGSLTHLELSVAPPGSLSPSKQASDQKMHTSVNSLPADNLLSLPSDSMNSAIAIERSCCKLSIDDTRAEEDSANQSSPKHAIVLHEETTDRSRVLELVEIPDEMVQETHYHRTLNDENPCTSTTEDGINHGRTCDGKISSVLPMNISVQDPCQQSLSVENLDEVVPLACILQETTSCLDIRGRIFLPQSGIEKNTYEQTPTETSLCPPQFLGLSLPMNTDSAVDFIKDSSSILSPSSPIFENRGVIHNRQLGWQVMRPPPASDENFSAARQKQSIDDILTSSGLLKGRQGSSLEKFKGCVNQWSEEELDFLWIGVRRHGRDNWEAMLRDSKLRFSEWRVAEDLAEQWNVEQSKLLNGTLIQPLRLSKAYSSPTISSGLLATAETESRYGGYGAERDGSKIPSLRTETELSLGDVYVQKEASIRKMYPFHLSGPASALPLSRNDGPDITFGVTNSVLQNMGSKQQKQINGQRSHMPSERKRARYDVGISTLQKKPVDRSTSHGPWGGEMFSYGKNKGPLNQDLPAGLPTKDNLPHWLREVFSVPRSMPQRPTGLAVPSSVSAIAHSVSLLYNDNTIIPPFSDPCMVQLPPKDPRQILKIRTNSNSACRRVSNISASIPAPAPSSTNVSWVEPKLRLRLSNLTAASESRISDQNNANNLNQTCYDPVRPNDLIVIDSDASSEETISDDRSGQN